MPSISATTAAHRREEFLSSTADSVAEAQSHGESHSELLKQPSEMSARRMPMFGTHWALGEVIQLWSLERSIRLAWEETDKSRHIIGEHLQFIFWLVLQSAFISCSPTFWFFINKNSRGLACQKFPEWQPTSVGTRTAWWIEVERVRDSLVKLDCAILVPWSVSVLSASWLDFGERATARASYAWCPYSLTLA